MSSSTTGFVIDLDGVVYTHAPGGGYELLPRAAEALERLQRERAPHVFVSNGTGSTGDAKAALLQRLTGVEVPPERVVLAATPMRDLAPQFTERLVMVVAASDAQARALGADAGFAHVVSLQAYAAAHPELLPHLSQETLSAGVAPPPEGQSTGGAVAAVMLMAPPDDWHMGLQILVDILRSRDGLVGAEHEADGETQQVVPLFAGNPDFDYGASHSVPRLTMGAFRVCLEQLYERSTGRALECENFGKPFAPIYAYAQRALPAEVTRVVAIGDNPRSDIAGAINMGWESVLVRTGCFKTGANDAEHPATHVCEGVGEALDWALGPAEAGAGAGAEESKGEEEQEEQEEAAAPLPLPPVMRAIGQMGGRQPAAVADVTGGETALRVGFMQACTIQRCVDATIEASGKASNVTIENCSRCVVTLDKVVAAVELVRCEGVTVRAHAKTWLCDMSVDCEIQVPLTTENTTKPGRSAWSVLTSASRGMRVRAPLAFAPLDEDLEPDLEACEPHHTELHEYEVPSHGDDAPDEETRASHHVFNGAFATEIVDSFGDAA